MFRLRYASGEEAIFRSVEELALGLRSGIIGTDTHVLDSEAHVWQPLIHHPLYTHATSLAATLHSYGDLELEPAVTAPVMVRTPSGQQRAVSLPGSPVLQMASISGGELQARRNQKTLIKAAIVLTAIAMVATSGFVIWRERSRGTSGAAEAGAIPVTAVAPLRRGAPVPNTAYWLSPGILAARRSDAQARIDVAFSDSSTRLHLQQLVALDKLERADSLRAALEGVSQWRSLAGRYREASFAMLKVYQDSANLQVRIDQWSLLDASDWRSRSAFVEGPVDALRADSLVSAVVKLYELLLSQQGQYQLQPGQASFTAHRARVEYERLSGILRRHGPAGANPADRVYLPLQLLRQALAGSGLPPIPPEPESQ